MAVVGSFTAGEIAFQRNIDDLQNAKLHVLVQRSGRPEVERGKQLGSSFGGTDAFLSRPSSAGSRRNEVADPAQNADADVVVLRKSN
jgi:hypothetical protein